MGICASFRSPTLERLYDVDKRQVLGEGTYSVVFRGKARVTGVPVAVKRVDKQQHALASPRRWEDEVAMLRQCGEHPNVISLRDVFETPTHVFIVTELAEGGELFQTLISEGAYSEWDAKRFARQILQALQFLHERNIVHRDIKPENLLLTSNDSKSATIKLADFGMAALVNSSSFLSTRHLTWAYCAPEIFRAFPELAGSNCNINDTEQGVACAGVKSDMWSLGIVLYVLLSGIHPFDPDGRHTREQIITSIQEGAFSITEPLWDPISPEAKSFLCKLLSQNPDDRPSAVEALKHEWFESPHTPRESLRVSVTNGLGLYQRMMQRKFRTSVLVALAANTFRRSLEKSRGSRSSIVKDVVSSPVSSIDGTDPAPDETRSSMSIPASSLPSAVTAASANEIDVTVHPESVYHPPLSTLARVLQRPTSSDAVDSKSRGDRGSIPVDVEVSESELKSD